MSWKTWVYIGVGILILSFSIITYYFPSVKDDGVVEESIEQVINGVTGVDCDLTPCSLETQNVDEQVKQ